MWLVWVLIVVIIGMLAIWRPWTSADSGRSVSVSGQATVESEPDEFVFSPTFELEGEDQAALTANITDSVEETIDALKALGVEDKDIKLNAYGGENYYYVYPAQREGEYRVTATLTISSDSRDEAQTIQDYLATTSASGQLTPSVQFSEAKQKELESQAREQAIADARTKAEQSASLLDARLGKVLEVSESSGFDIYPVDSTAELRADGSESSGLPVQPGQNKFTYSVSVKFQIR
ncbi:MAG TPA: SIMPL domain-containing protein [Candidatus Saccharimonadales bacterium]|jgi:hypothetical protein